MSQPWDNVVGRIAMVQARGNMQRYLAVEYQARRHEPEVQAWRRARTSRLSMWPMMLAAMGVLAMARLPK